MTEPEEITNPEPGARGWTLLFYALAIVFAMEILEHDAIQGHLLLRRATQATRGLVTVDLVASLIGVAVVGFLLCGVGRFGLGHFGLRMRALLPGVGVAFAIWGLTQILLAIGGLTGTGLISVYRGWENDPLSTINGVVRYLAGEAFFEEVFFRGYLMVWMVLELQSRMKDRFFATFVGVMSSQMLFAVIAIPGRLDAGIPWAQVPVELVLLTLTGVYYSILYIRTDNIFIPIAVHALSLWPAPLLDPPFDPSKLTILVSSIFLFFPAAERTREERGHGSGVWN